MAILSILRYPDERLHTVARPVEEVDDAIRKLVDDMAETMYTAPGIGLAATQVNVHRRVIVIDISETRNDLHVLINPSITYREGSVVWEEGCLSVPAIYDNVTRSQKIRMEALDREGRRYELEAEDLLAVCIQHEIDHLEGKVFVEYLSKLKQARIKARLKKQLRETM
jgi:peptide deformylase